MLLSMAKQVATHADCPNTIKTGSIRINPNAICDADKQTGTKRLLHSFSLGSKDLVATTYKSAHYVICVIITEYYTFGNFQGSR